MQDPQNLNLPQPDLPDSLRQLRPIPPTASARDIWYEAGYAAGHRSLNVWRATAVCLVLGMTGLFTWQHQSPTPTPPIPVVVNRPAPQVDTLPEPSLATGDSSYFQLRDGLIRDGIRGWPAQGLPSGNPFDPPGRRSSPSPIPSNTTNLQGES